MKARVLWDGYFTVTGDRDVLFAGPIEVEKSQTGKKVGQKKKNLLVYACHDRHRLAIVQRYLGHIV